MAVGADYQWPLSEYEQRIVIHALGHLESGPAAVNHLSSKCFDTRQEKHTKEENAEDCCLHKISKWLMDVFKKP